MTIQNAAAEAEADRDWAAFDAALTRKAHTRPEMINKLHHTLWALSERGCSEEAEKMIASCVSDLERAV